MCVNAATSEAVDAISFQPEFKYTAVALAKVEMTMPDDFTPAQKMILREILSGVSNHSQVNFAGAQVLPESAPFTAGQRRHINGLLAQPDAGNSEIEKRP